LRSISCLRMTNSDRHQQAGRAGRASGAGNPTGTLVNALIAPLRASLSGIGGVARPGIVHRLDKDTSGVMVVAKTDRAHKSLSDQFADHGRTGALERAYQAIVWGAPQRRRARSTRRSAGPRRPAEAGGGARNPARRPRGRDPLRSARNASARTRHQASAGRMPAGNRPHPPDPRAHGPYRPPAARRPRIWRRVSHQGQPPARQYAQALSTPSRARLCMLGCWRSSTRPPARTCALKRNCRPTCWSKQRCGRSEPFEAFNFAVNPQ
jgi:hypothetical protein